MRDSLYDKSVYHTLTREDEDGFKIVDVPKLTEIMTKCHFENRACLHLIIGERGAGKSTYAMIAADMLLKKVQGREGTCTLSPEYIIFTIDEFVHIVKKFYDKVYTLCADEGDPGCYARHREPALIIDDAGVHFSKYLPRYNMKIAQTVKGVIDLIRMSVSNIILTVPSHLDLMKSIREDVDAYIAVISYYNKDYSIANIFNAPRVVPWNKDWKIYRRKIAVEMFRRYTPCYSNYIKKREQMLFMTIDELEKLLKEAEMKMRKRDQIEEITFKDYENFDSKIDDSEYS